MKKETKNKLNIYSYIAVLFLSIYSLIMTVFLIDSHKEIKGIYAQIEERREMNIMISEKISLFLEERDLYISSLDLETDSSIYKFVSAKKSFDDVSYIPNDLVSINSDYIIDIKGGTQVLRREANDQLKLMGRDFYDKFSKKIQVVSAYRSYEYQLGIKKRGCPDNLCAKAGYSEHQSGLAVDLWEASTEKQFKSNKNYLKYFEWLSSNAHLYGFTNTYKRGLEIDTYEIEPWHWRYLGEELATYLYDNNLTFAQYYTKKELED